jgi:hypothetical protein
MEIKTYTLAKEDIERVREAGGKLAEIADLSAVRENVAVTVVEVDGTIAAYWGVFYALMAEPLWIAPEWRKHPGVVSGVIDAMLAEAYRTGEPGVMCTIIDQQVETYAQRLGFDPVPGRLFYKLLTPVPELVEV